MVLCDHLVTQRAAPVGYDVLCPEAQLELAEYTERCKGNTLVIGCIDPLTGLWNRCYPCAAVTGEELHRRRIYGTDKVRAVTAPHRRGDERYYRPPPSWERG